MATTARRIAKGTMNVEYTSQRQQDDQEVLEEQLTAFAAAELAAGEIRESTRLELLEQALVRGTRTITWIIGVVALIGIVTPVVLFVVAPSLGGSHVPAWLDDRRALALLTAGSVALIMVMAMLEITWIRRAGVAAVRHGSRLHSGSRDSFVRRNVNLLPK